MQFLGLGNFIHDKDAFTFFHIPINSILVDVKLSDGYFQGLYASSDPSLEQYSDGTLPSWDGNITVMRTDFNGTCNVNKSQIDIQAIDGLAIKKRIKDSNSKWETLYIHPVADIADFNFTFEDYLCKNNCKYQYNIVPVANGIETYFNNVVDVYSYFYGVYLTDGKLQYGTHFDIQSNYNRKTSSSTVQPINSRYPISIKNGQLNYSSGSINARLLKMNDDKSFDLYNGYEYRKEVVDFISQNRVLVLKNYDGLMAIVSIEGEISEDFGEHYLAPKISFSWTQIGDADDFKQLNNLGLIQGGEQYEYR